MAQDNPDPNDLLANAGLEAAEHEVISLWEERAPGDSSVLVTGMRVDSGDNLPPFDLYFNSHGEPIARDTLRELKIAPKDWDAPPVTQPSASDIPGASVKAAQTPPVTGKAPLDLVALPPLDLEALKKEDAAREKESLKGVKRIGVFRDFDEPVRVEGANVSHGAWRKTEAGEKVWSLSFYSPEAEGIRLEFAQLDLPEGARLVVYDIFEPEVAVGPITAIPEGDDVLWTPTIFAEEVVVECVAPAGVSVDEVRIHTDQLAHQYVSFDTLTRLKAGACNLDVACYEDWLEESYGVGGLGSIGRSGVLWCTASLLAGGAGDDVGRLLLTANHCLTGSSRSPGNVEVYWFYQRDECGGPIPPVTSVPRTTGGADALMRVAEHQGTDVALLRLREMPPEGVTALGWSNEPWEAWTPITGIHHPQGSYKRISFGDIRPFEGAAASGIVPENYTKVVWNAGTTEPGSSGSPLLLDDQGLLIGQLWGGEASCSNPLGPDYYGRFDQSFPLMKNWLFEPGEHPADVNNDGAVDSLDIQIVINVVLGLSAPEGVTEEDVDVNGDGKVNALDIQYVINAVLGIK